MNIRLYIPTDFDAITQLWRQAREVTFTEFMKTKGHTFEEDCAFFQNIILKETDVWVIETNSLVVGFMAIREDFIDQLYVSSDHQRQGIGTRLLAHARTLSPKRLWLHTFQSNLNGRTFYEKNGFVATNFGVSPAPESEPDILFEWNV